MNCECEIVSERQEKVLAYLTEHGIAYECYNHPEGKTIEEAKRWWKDDGSVHCKNILCATIRVRSTI
jgi:Ala-tRNA(Pro) deacylase